MNIVRVAPAACFCKHFLNNQATKTSMTVSRSLGVKFKTQDCHMKYKESVWMRCARLNNIFANIEKHKQQAVQDIHITYLELGLGIAGAFFPFSPFPSYPFPRAVVFDILRDCGCILCENGPATQNGPEARRAMTSTRGDASADGANRRAKCIQSAQMESIKRKGDISTV
jgi:hypothetical protein